MRAMGRLMAVKTAFLICKPVHISSGARAQHGRFGIGAMVVLGTKLTTLTRGLLPFPIARVKRRCS